MIQCAFTASCATNPYVIAIHCHLDRKAGSSEVVALEEVRRVREHAMDEQGRSLSGGERGSSRVSRDSEHHNFISCRGRDLKAFPLIVEPFNGHCVCEIGVGGHVFGACRRS